MTYPTSILWTGDTSVSDYSCPNGQALSNVHLELAHLHDFASKEESRGLLVNSVKSAFKTIKEDLSGAVDLSVVFSCLAKHAYDASTPTFLEAFEGALAAPSSSPESTRFITTALQGCSYGDLTDADQINADVLADMLNEGGTHAVILGDGRCPFGAWRAKIPAVIADHHAVEVIPSLDDDGSNAGALITVAVERILCNASQQSNRRLQSARARRQRRRRRRRDAQRVSTLPPSSPSPIPMTTSMLTTTTPSAVVLPTGLIGLMRLESTPLPDAYTTHGHCSRGHQAIIDELLCPWGIAVNGDFWAQGDVYGPVLASGDVGVLRITPSGSPDAFPITRPALLAGGKAHPVPGSNGLEVSLGHIRTGDLLPSISLNQPARFRSMNLGPDAALTPSMFETIFDDLQCVQDKLCHLEPSHQHTASRDGPLVLDATAHEDTGMPTNAVFALDWSDLTPSEVQAKGFEQANAVIINLFNAPSEAEWRWKVNGSDAAARRTVINFCDEGGPGTKLTISSPNYRIGASMFVNGRECDLHAQVGAIYGCSGLTQSNHAMGFSPFCAVGLDQLLTWTDDSSTTEPEDFSTTFDPVTTYMPHLATTINPSSEPDIPNTTDVVVAPIPVRPRPIGGCPASLWITKGKGFFAEVGGATWDDHIEKTDVLGDNKVRAMGYDEISGYLYAFVNEGPEAGMIARIGYGTSQGSSFVVDYWPVKGVEGPIFVAAVYNGNNSRGRFVLGRRRDVFWVELPGAGQSPKKTGFELEPVLLRGPAWGRDLAFHPRSQKQNKGVAYTMKKEKNGVKMVRVAIDFDVSPPVARSVVLGEVELASGLAIDRADGPLGSLHFSGEGYLFANASKTGSTYRWTVPLGLNDAKQHLASGVFLATVPAARFEVAGCPRAFLPWPEPTTSEVPMPSTSSEAPGGEDEIDGAEWDEYVTTEEVTHVVPE